MIDALNITILDAVIFIFLIVGFLVGWRRGLLSEVVAVVGLVAVLWFSWVIKGQVSAYFYTYLPFFKFGGIIKGITSLNILAYELIAFCLIITVLGAVLGIVLKVTGLFEKVLRVTVLLSFPSKVMGSIIGVLEAYIIIFVVLCVLSQPFVTFVNVSESKWASKIVNKTPVASSYVQNVIKSAEEIYDLIESRKKYDAATLDYKSLEILLKYDVIEPKNLDYLIEKGKITIKGAQELSDKYR